MGGKLRPADILLVPAVAKTIKQLETSDADAGAIALAKRYARELDDAAVISAAITKALRDLYALDVSGAIELHDRFLALAVRIEESAVAASIGPKLLAALESLGATPAARAKLRGGGAPSGGPSRLEQMRNARGA